MNIDVHSYRQTDRQTYKTKKHNLQVVVVVTATSLNVFTSFETVLV